MGGWHQLNTREDGVKWGRNGIEEREGGMEGGNEGRSERILEQRVERS